MDSATKTSVLTVYFSFTNQTQTALDAIADVLQGHDCKVTFAPIDLTDPRNSRRLETFPLKSDDGWPLHGLPASLVTSQGNDAADPLHVDILMVDTAPESGAPQGTGNQEHRVRIETVPGRIGSPVPT